MEESKNLREAVVIDAVDRQIIEQLQLNGRMTNAELAERVGIAPSTCVARVRSLVSRGIITGFTASVDPAVMGMTLQVLVSVTIRSGARQTERVPPRNIWSNGFRPRVAEPGRCDRMNSGQEIGIVTCGNAPDRRGGPP